MTATLAPSLHPAPGVETGAGTLVVPADTRAQLTTCPCATPLVQPEIRLTGDVDEFRAWLSVQGDPFQTGARAVPAELRPSGRWTRGADFSPAELTAAEVRDIRRAAQCYLFGHREAVQDYREAIMRMFAPFSAAFYTAGRIVVEPGARLVVDGHPAVITLDELVIRAGGNLRAHVPFRLAVEHLHTDAA